MLREKLSKQLLQPCNAAATSQMGQKCLGRPSLLLSRQGKDYGIANTIRTGSVKINPIVNKVKIKWLKQQRSSFFLMWQSESREAVLTHQVYFLYDVTALLTSLEWMPLTCTLKLGSPSYFCILVPERGERMCGGYTFSHTYLEFAHVTCTNVPVASVYIYSSKCSPWLSGHEPHRTEMIQNGGMKTEQGAILGIAV